MSGHQPGTTAMELAALYVSGAMSPAERAALEEAIEAGDAELARAVADFDVVTRGLAETVDPVTPDPAIRRAILAVTHDDLEVVTRGLAESAASPEPHVHVWDDWAGDKESDGLFTLQADEGRWEQTGVDGILVRRLFVDRAANRMTAMFKMAPGSVYLPHVHGGPEECYVLEGDLHVGDDLVMRAGDYQRASAGSLHGVQRTEGGCTLLITCSLDDEVV